MSGSLGLSVGAASLVAARVGGTPVARRSVLTVFDHRPPEVGVPDDNVSLTEPGLTLSGFIKRIGDPMPIVGPDGSTHRSDVLAAEALDAIARSAGYGAPVAVAVPGHWKQNAVAALRDALRPNAALSPGGVPPMLISDATTALAALYSRPGFPSDGVIVLCDFGASGTSITLTDAAANFPQIGETVRYTGFSGDQIDQAILNHLQSTNGGGDTTRNARVGTLSGRLDECRRAKEQLSAATVAVVPGHDQDERLTRTELEHLISGNLERLIDAVQEILQRNEIATSRLAAVATVGGGACIPLITQQLEARLQVPVVTTPQPTLSAAIGAAVLAARRSAGGATTAIGVTSPVDMGTAAPDVVEGGAPNGNLAYNGLDPAPPTEIIPSGWAAGAARAAAGESVADGVRSATYRALAWSQEASTGGEPVAYTGEDHSGEYSPSPPPAPQAVTPEPVASEPVDAEPVDAEPVEPERSRGLKRSGVVFGVAAIAALAILLTAGLVAHKLSSDHTGPVRNTTTLPSPSRLPSVGSLTPEPPPPPVQTATAPSTTEEMAPQPVPSTTQQPITTTPKTTTTTTTTPTTIPTPSTNYSYPPVTPNYPYPVYPPATTPPTVAPPLPPLVPVRPTYGQ